MRTAAIAAICLAVLPAGQSVADFRTDCAKVDTTPLRRTSVALKSGKAQVKINAEVALSGGEKRRGLMCRETLPDGSGMLFPYKKHMSDGFWMFNTHIDLEILYIAEDGTVIEKVRMKKCPRESDEHRQAWKTRCALQSENYRPKKPYKAALEIPAGYLERNGFLPGETIRAEWKIRNR